MWGNREGNEPIKTNASLTLHVLHTLHFSRSMTPGSTARKPAQLQQGSTLLKHSRSWPDDALLPNLESHNRSIATLYHMICFHIPDTAPHCYTTINTSPVSSLTWRYGYGLPTSLLTRFKNVLNLNELLRIW
jgi:hypothetical protein